MISEPTVICPNCRHEIRLTESLAAPLIEETRRAFEEKSRQRDMDFQRREAALRDQKDTLEKEKVSLADRVQAELKKERALIAEAEAKRARAAVDDEINRRDLELLAAKDLLKQRDLKLAEAQRYEIELRQERQRLQDERNEFEVNKQRALDEERRKIRDVVLKEAEEQARMKLAERDKTITDLQLKLQDAMRQATQGSQQLQGEIQEIALENTLRAKFPRDTIEPVSKGEFGGDILHRVLHPSGQVFGTILWESKRTKTWSDSWLAKLRSDQRAARAEVAILVSQTLPKGLEYYDLIDGIWVTDFRCFLPLAVALREGLLEAGAARLSKEGQQSKMEMVYHYLTGPRFRQRIEAIVEKFSEMQEDLDKERKSLTKLWARRETQIRGVLDSTAGLFGDLQGIAGRSLPEIAGLDFPALEDSGHSTQGPVS